MFEEKIIDRVWAKATPVGGCDPNVMKKDSCGAWIKRDEYGNRESMYGWEIEHIYPIAKGGDDRFVNLRAMQWENCVRKGDEYPCYMSAVMAEGEGNVHREKEFTVSEKVQGDIARLYSL